jgi:hypothetical protein
MEIYAFIRCGEVNLFFFILFLVLITVCGTESNIKQRDDPMPSKPAWPLR